MSKQLQLGLVAADALPRRTTLNVPYPIFEEPPAPDCNGVHLGKDDNLHWHPGGCFGKRWHALSCIRERAAFDKAKQT